MITRWYWLTAPSASRWACASSGSWSDTRPSPKGAAPARSCGRAASTSSSEIRAIDPDARAAETDACRLDGDHLVVALGAVSRPELVPGLAPHGHDVWSFAGVPSAASALCCFSGGRIVVLIAGAPYPCPPAPFECAMHLHEHLHARGIRQRSEIAISTVQPMLMPNAGREGSEWMAALLDERGIGWRVASPVERVEEGRVVLVDGALEFDLLIAVPPHQPPPVVAESGLTGRAGGSPSMAGPSRRAVPASSPSGTSPASASPTACRCRRPG